MDRIGKLEEWLQQNPGDPFVLHALALENIKAGEEQKAREIFEEILQKNPDYIGSYYHYAKLLERIHEPLLAQQWYEKGMAAARKNGDQHAFSELQAALENLQE